jgi:outer membrane receptor for ferrienterochelin and colicins
MRIRFVSRLLAVLGIFAATTALGAQAGSVTGRVTETESGNPVSGATIAVLSGATQVASGQSGADGTYRVSGVPAGTYVVLVRMIGYGARRIEGVTVTAGGTATANTTLSLTATQLNQVVTTGTRGAEPEKILDSPNSISLISSERIAERPSVTVTDHLKGTPGLSISQGGLVQANIVSRGFNNAFSTSMMMLQDYRFAGVPSLRVNVPFLFTGTGEDIDRIEVLQGPASALYGPNSGAGVLHIITKSPFQSQGTSVTLDGGMQSMMRLAGRHAGVFGGGKFGYKLSGEIFRASDFEYNDPNEPATYSAVDPRIPASRQGDAVARDFSLSKYGFEARLDYRPNDDTEWINTFGYTKLGNAIEITTTFGAAQAREWSYSSFQSRFRRKQFFAQMFFNGSNSGNEDPLDDAGTFYLRSGIPVVDKSTVMVVQAQQGFTLGRTRMVGGIDYIATTPQTEGSIMGRNEDDDNISEMGGYLQLTQPLSAKVDFVGAARLDMNSRIDGNQFSPRAAFLYKHTPTQNFRFTFNRAFNSPASFSFFLDQWAGVNQNLGPMVGTREVRIFGNPPKEGWRYDRSGTASINNGLRMRGPGGVLMDANAALTLPGFMNAGTSTALVNAIATTFGLNATQQTNIRNALNAVNPTNAQVGTVFRNVAAPGSPIITTPINDLKPLGANFSNTWELGWKGIFGNNLRLSADYWYQVRPADPTTGLIPQIAFYNPTQLGAYLSTHLNATVAGPSNVLAANGVPASFIPSVLNGWVTSLAGAPVGALNFDNPIYDQTYLVFTYQNGNGTVDVRGIDLAADYLVNEMYSVEVTYSNLNRNVFADAPGATAASPLVANTPKHRGSLTVRRTNEARGMTMEVRARYADAMRVNSGVLNTYNVGTPVPYPWVPVNAFLDAGFSWRLPVAQQIRWSLNGQNLLNNEVATFPGVAPQGLLITTRVQYTF